MKKFLLAVKAWIIAHKVIAIVIAGAAALAITTAVVVPVSVSAAKRRKAAEQDSQQSSSGDQGGGGGSSAKTYTITWKDDNGTVLETDHNVAEGTLPTFDSVAPTKASTNAEEFAFSGWTPAISAATSDTIYTATYSSTPIKYSITWVDGNGATLKVDQVAYGQVPVYEGADPTKASTTEEEFAWNHGWDTEPVAVTGNATYTAEFNSSARKYAITWVDGNGATLKVDQVAYGQVPVYSGADPTKNSTVGENFTWNHAWDVTPVAVTGEATYTATFNSSVRQYTIKWVDGDGTELKSELVNYNVTPVYDGADPTKAKTPEHTYTWTGEWNVTPVPAVADATYTATFNDSKTQYSVKLINSDDSVIKVLDGTVAYDADVDLTGESKPDYPDDVSLDSNVEWVEQARDEVNYIRIFKAQHTITHTKDSYFSYTDLGESYRLDGFAYMKSAENIIVPSTYNSKPVTFVRNYAFSNNKVLKSVHLPETVTTIDNQAFSGWTNIESFICDGAATLNYMAGYELKNCKHFEIKGHNGDAYTFNGNYALEYLGNLVESEDVELILGEGLTSISYSAVRNSNVKSINIQKSFTSIGDYAFKECEKLVTCEVGKIIDDVRVSDLVSIGEESFASTPLLEEFFISPTVTSIGAYAFNCSGIGSVVIPAGCTTVGRCAFAECPNLRHVEILNNMSYTDIADEDVFDH